MTKRKIKKHACEIAAEILKKETSKEKSWAFDQYGPLGGKDVERLEIAMVDLIKELERRSRNKSV